MRLPTLVPVLLAASLAAACGQATADGASGAGSAGTVGRVAVEACGDDCTDCSHGLDIEATEAADGTEAIGTATAAAPGPAAELVTVRLAVMGMG